MGRASGPRLVTRDVSSKIAPFARFNLTTIMPSDICFVIQPFDKGRFDKRFSDILKPAIESCGLEAYRVDLDPASSIPINDIEKGIRDSRLCLADITLDNPNVWFELGYAISAKRPVVLLCSNERQTKFPFDVQHRTIIRYTTESPSDFEDLKKQIIGKIKAELHKETSLQNISDSALAQIEGLSPHEIVVLAAIAENLYTPEDNASVGMIKRDVEKAGFTRVAVLIAMKLLVEKGFVTYSQYPDNEGEPYTGYSLTSDGWNWIVRNEDKFQIRKPPEEDLPF